MAAALLWLASQHAFANHDVLLLLNQPGTHAIMRHATAPGVGDPEGFVLGDCTTQRNLSQAGLNEARALGETLAKKQIRFTAVYSSQWCRCLHTAHALNAGQVQALPALNSFFQQRDKESEQTRLLQAFLRTLQTNDKVMLVTHQVNITALTGIVPRPGEVIVFTPHADGSVKVLGRWRPDEL
ncbi:MAG TPA: histidine phosphatase family protein [Limnobacter sp.]|nr:histidine phosphatase family protein [Limnobacter sp.]